MGTEPSRSATREAERARTAQAHDLRFPRASRPYPGSVWKARHDALRNSHHSTNGCLCQSNAFTPWPAGASHLPVLAPPRGPGCLPVPEGCAPGAGRTGRRTGLNTLGKTMRLMVFSTDTKTHPLDVSIPPAQSCFGDSPFAGIITVYATLPKPSGLRQGGRRSWQISCGVAI